MNLPYWREHYLLGEAEDIAERISRRVGAVGGRTDWIVLNPVDWDPEQLERLASEVLPRVSP